MKKGEENWIIVFVLCLSILLIPLIAGRVYKSILISTTIGSIALIISIIAIIFILNRK
jgi:hypothetical protein